MANANIHKLLLDWYDEEKRDLPWRKTKDPYAIWVSEVMLQQTQVATVLPYYESWMKRFPNLEALATAEEQEVLSQWQGLGYYRRCRMLQQGARFVREHRPPQTAEDWRKVPGVGPYTAGALASIANGQRVPLVDGNVERVFARLTGNKASGKDLKKSAWQWAESVLPEHRAGDWNQALMELGATTCRPANPSCDMCPLRKMCEANHRGMQSELPTKSEKPKVVTSQEIVWVPCHKGSFGLRQLPKGEWWQGMWEFPRVPSNAESELLKLVGAGRLEDAGTITYQVTHHRVNLRAFVHHSATRTPTLEWHREKELIDLPMPAPQRKVLRLALSRLSAPALIPEP